MGFSAWPALLEAPNRLTITRSQLDNTLNWYLCQCLSISIRALLGLEMRSALKYWVEFNESVGSSRLSDLKNVCGTTWPYPVKRTVGDHTRFISLFLQTVIYAVFPMSQITGLRGRRSWPPSLQRLSGSKYGPEVQVHRCNLDGNLSLNELLLFRHC